MDHFRAQREKRQQEDRQRLDELNEERTTLDNILIYQVASDDSAGNEDIKNAIAVIDKQLEVLQQTLQAPYDGAQLRAQAMNQAPVVTQAPVLRTPTQQASIQAQIQHAPVHRAPAQPMAAQPVAAQPVAAQPVAAQPVAAQPVFARRIPAQPTLAQRASAQPSPAQDVAAQRAPNQHAPAEHARTQHARTQHAPGQLAPGQLAPGHRPLQLSETMDLTGDHIPNPLKRQRSQSTFESRANTNDPQASAAPPSDARKCGDFKADQFSPFGQRRQ